MKRILTLTLALALLLLYGLPARAAGFTSLSQPQYTVSYKNWDGAVLQVDSNENSEEVPYRGSTPTRPSDSMFDYAFSGWSKKQARSTQNRISVTYTAQYTSTIRDPNKRVIVWKNDNGRELKREYLTLGAMPAWSGTTPGKSPDEQNDYAFSGWSPAISAVTGDAVYTAQYTATPARYQVTWENDDHTVLKTLQNVTRSAVPAYDGATPFKARDAASTYIFSGWMEKVSVSDRTLVYTAKYTAATRAYVVTWKDLDGRTITSATVAYGEKAVYSGEAPEKPSDSMYKYIFSGWNPDLDIRITGDTVFTPVYTAAPRDDFTITWKNWDGTVLEKDEGTVYGSTPEYDGALPVRPQDERKTYSFLAWTPETKTVTRDAVYTASFLPTTRSYTVTWKDWNGETLETEEYSWGSMPSYPGGDPERDADTQWRYSFRGWEPGISFVAGNAEYTAQYDTAPNVYTVKFRKEDGAAAFAEIPDQTVPYGDTAQAPAYTPVKEGCRFVGWASGGETFDLNAPLTGSEDTEIILTPIFKTLYTVRASNIYAGGNGEGSVTWQSETGDATDQEITGVQGERITVTAAPREDCALSCFIIDCNDTDVPYTLTGDNKAEFIMPAGEVAITARFMLKEDVLEELKDDDDENLFHIRSANDLVLLSKWSQNHNMAGQTIRLDTDLNMAGVTFEGFSGAFHGTFDGGGHTVRNLHIHGFTSENPQSVGFFWDLRGSVSGLILTGDVSDGARHKTGGLVGSLRNTGSVTGCTAIMRADDPLVCLNFRDASAVSNCWYAGGDSEWGTRLYTIEAGDDFNHYGEAVISDISCPELRTIDGIQYFPQGCDVTLTLTAQETVGLYSLAGFVYDFDDSHYLNLNAEDTYTIPSVSEDLTICPDYKYQMGLDYQDGKYLVRSRADLEAIARAVNQTSGCSSMAFLLMNDIDFNGESFDGIAVGTDDYFYGAFDGNDYTIRNMVIASASSNVGFIGQLGGSLQRLTLENCTVIGPEDAAMLAGGGWGGRVQSCRVLGGSVQANHAGAIYLDDYSNYSGGTDNLYDTNVTVISDGTVIPVGECGTCYGDSSYASVMWTVSFLSEEGGTAMAEPQKVADSDVAVSPEISALPLREHVTFTGSWKREDGTDYTFDPTWLADEIRSDTVLYAVWETETMREILLTDGQQNGQSRTVSTYISESGGWTLPACDFAPKEGMTFDCWEYEGLTYAPGDKVALGSEPVVNARWKWIPHDIFASDGEITEVIYTAHYMEVCQFMVYYPGLREVSVTCVSASGQDIPVTAFEGGLRYAFVMPNEDVTLFATFDLEEYMIEVVGLENGVLLVNGSQVDPAGPVTAHYLDEITVVPNTGFQLESLEVKDAALDPVETENGSFLMPDLSVTVTARIVESIVFGAPDFTLPAGPIAIEESAFEGMPLLHIVDAGGVTSIGKWAFKDSGLQQIRLPQNCQIDPDAFDGCNTVYVFAPADGTTEAFCQGHDGVIFVETH